MDQGRFGSGRDLAIALLAVREGLITPEGLVEAMLEWDADRSRPIRDVLVARGTLTADRAEALDARVAAGRPRPGRFRVLRPHARGGVGEVFVAEDAELHREVALKEILPHLADHADSRARFVVEAEITGGLEHPGIVPVYSLGRHADGRPYYAMRLVRGQTLLDAIRKFHENDGPTVADPGRRARELRRLLTRFVAVCEAIAYAHSRRVIHRDLKPRNILLGRFGETLVVDWGVAKAMDDPDPDSTAVAERPIRPASGQGVEATIEGRTVGTPAYMAPEQAEGLPGATAPAADIYGLGATLYHLLTGRPPFEGDDAAAILHRVRIGGFTPPHAARPDLAPALGAICLRAMAANPEDRYPSALALADDVERWLGDEPVAALREPPAARLARWGRRNQSRVVAVAAGLVLLASVLVACTFQQKFSYVAGLRLADAGVLKVEREAAARERLRDQDRAARETRVRDYYARVDRAREARASARPGWTGSVLGDLAAAGLLDDGFGQPETLRDEAIRALAGLDLRRGQALDPALAATVAPSLAVSPDGRRVVAIRHRPLGRVEYAGRVLDSGSGAIARSLYFLARLDRAFGALETVNDAVFSPDGRRLAVATSGGLVHLWDRLDADTPPASWPAAEKPVHSLLFSPDGGSLYVASEDGFLRRWALPVRPGDGLPVEVASAPIAATARVWRSAGSPDLLAIRDRSLCRFEPQGLRQVGSHHLGPRPEAIEHVGPSPDGRSVAFVAGGLVGLLSLDGGPARMMGGGRLAARTDQVHFALRFSPDGSLLMASYHGFTGRDRGVKVWEVASGRLAIELPVPGIEPVAAAFSPDGRRLFVLEDRQLVAHEVGGLDVQARIAPSPGPARAMAMSPDGSTLATLARRPAGPDLERVEAALWSLPDGSPGACRSEPAGPPLDDPTARHALAFDPSGRRIALTTGGSQLHFWNPDNGGEPGWATLDTQGIHPVVAFESDRCLWGIMGRKGADDRVFTLEPGCSNLKTRWLDDQSRERHGLHGLNDLAVAGGRVLVAGHDGDCHLFRDGDPADALPITWAGGDSIRARDPAQAVAMTPDGSWAAVGTQSGRLHVRPVEAGRPVLTRDAHQAPIAALAFSPDGRTLATGASDRTLRLWSIDRGILRRLATLPAPDAPVRALRFGPDGAHLYALVEGEHAVRAWNLDRLRDRLAGMGLAW